METKTKQKTMVLGQENISGNRKSEEHLRDKYQSSDGERLRESGIRKQR